MNFHTAKFISFSTSKFNFKRETENILQGIKCYQDDAKKKF